MYVYTFKQTQNLPITISQAWNFFSNPKNINEITPPWLHFKIVNDIEEKMYSGQIIIYKINILLGIPQNWVTEIKFVKELSYFVDEQRYGPYKLWHHKHIFKEKDGCVEITDLVHYALPLGIVGRFANKIYVKKRLKEIFNYRYDFLKNKFNK